MEPLSVVSTIMTVVQLIGSAAATARQNKDKCLDLAGRASNLGYALPDFAKVAANSMATLQGLERLKDALGEAFTLIQSCQQASIFSGFNTSGKAAELDNVNRKINDCLSDLNFFSLARGQAMSTHNNVAAAAGSAPDQTYDYSFYYQAQGVPASTYVGFPQPQHGTVNAQWIPAGPAPYPAYPAPSGYNYASFYTLPTVNKIFDSVFR